MHLLRRNAWTLIRSALARFQQRAVTQHTSRTRNVPYVTLTADRTVTTKNKQSDTKVLFTLRSRLLLLLLLLRDTTQLKTVLPARCCPAAVLLTFASSCVSSVKEHS